ncbi:MAG: hypothetical protein HWD61_15670 [Parachlamydiaceae bacterium]|nr:MAG: hypothetical protein HWD61_15670 [Parachlamydiaceae bacterium]
MESFIRKDIEACARLLPLLNLDVQAQFIIKILDAISSAAYPRSYNILLNAAERLPNEAWEKASSQMKDLEYRGGIKFLPGKLQAAIVNGKAGNEAFVREVLENVFSTEEIQDQKKFIAVLKPNNFEFENPRSINPEIWTQFFKAISDAPTAHEKNFLVHFSQQVFRNLSHYEREYLNILSPEQIKLLPLETYPVDLHLIFAF